jgi:ribosomal protein S18 acetylase RimI-like enzyme
MAPPIRSAARFGVSYRPAGDEDAPFLGAVYASTRAEEVAATGWPIEQQHAFLAQQHEAQHIYYRQVYTRTEWLVIERGGVAIGRLYLAEWQRELRIVDIALLPEGRGQGVGEAIMRDIGADAASRGKVVSIHVEKNNPARTLYERLGFVPVEDKGVYELMEWTPPRAEADGGEPS